MYISEETTGNQEHVKNTRDPERGPVFVDSRLGYLEACLAEALKRDGAMEYTHDGQLDANRGESKTRTRERIGVPELGG